MASILVVDDEHMIRVVLIRVIRSMGHTPVPAASVGEAILYIPVGVDAIISDYRIGAERGCTLYNWVKEYTPHLLNHFMFCSGSSHEIKIDVPILSKPFSTEELRNSVNNVLTGERRDEKGTRFGATVQNL
jgi:DNA-binding NtrC family response regulator